VPVYLFYVYPLFLIIAAYGLSNIIESEILVIKKSFKIHQEWLKKGVIVCFMFIFVVSPWLRITINIPFLGDGITNLAMTPDEWREASRFVRDQKEDGDLLISSLPQVAYYYDILSDYGLNWANLAQAKEEEFKNSEGKWADVYSGITCIETLDSLKQILKSRKKGWILVAAYHLKHSNYLPDDVRQYIEEKFQDPYKTKHGTVLVFQWPDRIEVAH